MTHVWCTLLAAVCFTVSSGDRAAAHDCLPSAPPGHLGTHPFERGDLNRDGLLTRDEWQQLELERFDTYDRNRDGVVDGLEASAGRALWREQRFGRRFRELDRNGDGALTRDEVALPPQRFARLDRNRDRRLSFAELRADYGAMARPERGALAALLARWDANHDGVMTRGEAQWLAERSFQVHDRDHDGVLTFGEARAARDSRMTRRR